MRSGETSYCPVCDEALMQRSWRTRMLIDTFGKKVVCQIRRLRCAKCERIHHELPDCMVPYKRHCADTFEKISLEGLGDLRNQDLPCENRTILRLRLWLGTVLPYFMNILKTLSAKFGVPHNPTPTFKEIVRAAVNSSNWIFVAKPCTRSDILSR